MEDRGISLKRIKYASSGFTDFTGAGKIFETIKDFIINYFPNSKQKAEVELIRLQKVEKEIHEIVEVN